MFNEINQIQEDLPINVKWKSNDTDDINETGTLENIKIDDGNCEFHFTIRLSDMSTVVLKTNWYKFAFIDSTNTLMGCLWSIKLLINNHDQRKENSRGIKCLIRNIKSALSAYT